MVALGIQHDKIALILGLRSPKTLRKHFRHELDVGAIEAICTVGKTAFDMAKSGEHPRMTIFFLKARGGWREQPAFESAAGPPPPFIVAQEQAGG
jgi:hypothetical protein